MNKTALRMSVEKDDAIRKAIQSALVKAAYLEFGLYDQQIAILTALDDAGFQIVRKANHKEVK